MTSFPDSQMQNLLQKARKYSTNSQQGRFSPEKDNIKEATTETKCHHSATPTKSETQKKNPSNIPARPQPVQIIEHGKSQKKYNQRQPTKIIPAKHPNSCWNGPRGGGNLYLSC